MNNKIGILTFFRPINNGAVLQATAMNRIILKKMGYESEMIDYRLPRIEKYRSVFPTYFLKEEKNIFGKIKRFLRLCLDYKKNKQQISYYDKFINTHLIKSKPYYTYEDLKKDCQQYDKYIVGSDMVWNPLMTDGVNPIYYFDFVNKGKTKVAYAASVGTTNLSNDELDKMIDLINQMDYISLRENSSTKQLQKYTDKELIPVLDPTLLTEMDDWNEFYDSKRLIKEDYIFAFTLEENELLYKQVNELAKKYNLKIVAYDNIDSFKSPKGVEMVRYKSGPAEFLNYIKNANYVVTNSFHGCAFSLIFEKELYCIPHTTRGNRMRDLLKNLEVDRIVEGESKISEDIIDYNKVNKLKAELTKKSLNFLKKSLS